MTEAREGENESGFALFVPIAKVDRERREVWGWATLETMDQQGEVVDYDASVKAFDEWGRNFERATGGVSRGNLREMHQPKAVGTVIASKPVPEKRGIWVGAKLSQSSDGENAWQKVLDRTLTGFSIGAPKAERKMEYDSKLGKMVNRVVGYKLSELSLVDNPACPGADIKEIKVQKGMLDVIGDEAEPRGEAVEKTFEANAYVDESGRVWKLVEGRVVAVNERKGRNMGDLEKAKKNIGPSQREQGGPPGPERPAVAQGNEQMGFAAPKSAASANVPPAGISHEDDEHAVSGEGQGKASGVMSQQQGAPTMQTPSQSAPPPAPATPSGTQAPVQRMPYCAMCGKATQGPIQTPPAPAMPMQRAAESDEIEGLSKLVKVIETTGSGLSKVAEAIKATEGKFASVTAELNKTITALSQRVTTIEKTPMPGGPMRTELPGGVRPVEKGATTNGDEGVSKSYAAALERVIATTGDPFLRDQLSRELAKSVFVQGERDGSSKKVLLA
jgi:hypothetical protein